MDSESGRVYTRTKDKQCNPCVTTLILVFLALHTTMLIVGIQKRGDCPVQEKIPLYLIVAGATGIISKLVLLLLMRICNSPYFCLTVLLSFLLFLLILFEIVWIIVGTVWIYSIYQPEYVDIDHSKYCNKSAYLMSFWLITVNWALFVVAPLVTAYLIVKTCSKFRFNF